MKVFHRIEVVDLTLAELATSKRKRNELKDALDEFGAEGWGAVQIEERGGALLVLLSKQVADGG